MLVIFALLSAVCLAFGQKLWLLGDSTMSNHHVFGFGNHLVMLLDIPIINRAVPGTSYRTWTASGGFAKVAKDIQPGDYVLLEFGKNDPQSAKQSGDCNTEGKCGDILTYTQYARKAVQLFKSVEARVIISGPVPDDMYAFTPIFEWTPSRFTTFAQNVALHEGVMFINHEATTAAWQKDAGRHFVDSCYHDRVHTNAKGAPYLAGTFVRALICAHNPLALRIKIPHDRLPPYCSPDQIPLPDPREVD
ncbi:carbohydrate esterase family 12 protein [Mixia osmundae IAM 14324]|uniref:SGNH hydrolase-type esterase domain-containing protein n=1 Tax=Mixia osmundae (strain CBS 9802 / IAM 14324 / JCM 22182 / KY 12970) TaxID=764103 RepID=G7E6X7_MIXOS|nr:carbohydrate esterase family 12 protein [Mixia osmundae IAM 14324]KEI39030.1 carbohydrate esterase family 12 protein [Mixia osmundae IAM 14324]GAA98587.1 hypothetical protein E5Q_05274 [Mixia osmundae IAM 14324]